MFKYFFILTGCLAHLALVHLDSYWTEQRGLEGTKNIASAWKTAFINGGTLDVNVYPISAGEIGVVASEFSSFQDAAKFILSQNELVDFLTYKEKKFASPKRINQVSNRVEEDR